MALFGLPGGAEWLILAGIVLLLFAPSLITFWLGYVTGRRAAERAAGLPDAVVVPSMKEVTSEAEAEAPSAAPEVEHPHE